MGDDYWDNVLQYQKNLRIAGTVLTGVACGALTYGITYIDGMEILNQVQASLSVPELQQASEAIQHMRENMSESINVVGYVRMGFVGAMSAFIHQVGAEEGGLYWNTAKKLVHLRYPD
ncbi:MAG TPA: hypothetical protein VGF14_04250 [Alphaproteobacteria bacterium]